MKCMTIVPFMILMSSTASHEPYNRASKAARWKNSMFLRIGRGLRTFTELQQKNLWYSITGEIPLKK
jgi:hypothetical protein